MPKKMGVEERSEDLQVIYEHRKTTGTSKCSNTNAVAGSYVLLPRSNTLEKVIPTKKCFL